MASATWNRDHPLAATLEAMRELPALRTLQYGTQKESFEL